MLIKPQLTTLNLLNNRFSGTLTAELAQLTRITGLGLNYNRISGTLSAKLAQLTQLTQWLFGGFWVSFWASSPFFCGVLPGF